MNRAIKRSPSNNSSPASFPYGISGTRSPLSHQLEGQSHSQVLNDSENNGELQEQRDRANHLALLDPNFLLKAFERGSDLAGREAFVAFANGIKNMPGSGAIRSPSPNAIIKYMQGQQSPGNNNSGSEQETNRQLTPSPPPPVYESPVNLAASPARSTQDDDESVRDQIDIPKRSVPPSSKA